MKTNFFKPVFSLSAIAFAVFGAFAFTPAPVEAEAVAIFGMRPIAGCPVTSISCGQDITKPYCNNGTVDLYNWNAQQTACNVHLYKLN